MQEQMLHYRILVNAISVFTTIFLAIQVYSQTCGRSKHPPRNKIGDIVNATKGEFPWMASVGMMDDSNTFTFLCSGFLIDRRHVVSAAHCFDRVEPTSYFARIGSLRRSEGDEYSVMKLAVPESYRPGFYYNDIAILTLSREVDIPDFVPVCLPDGRITRMDFSGMGLTLVGWGFSMSENFSPYLLELRDVIVVNNEACNEIFEEFSRFIRKDLRQGVSPALMCAGFSEETGICVFSGGPLMFKDRNRWFAVGMVSFGIDCGGAGVPDGFTNISSHLNWIRRNTRHRNQRKK